jgi:3-keto-5-aminohexanoate cleavage enzyme
MTDLSPFEYGDTYAWMERVTSQPPLVITAALNGGVQGKEANPSLPEKPEEIAAAAREAYEAGASVVHIHGRDPHDWAQCTNDPEVYAEINALVRAACPDVIINNTTGGGPATTMEGRVACLAALPEMASLNLGPDMSRFRLPERAAPLEHPHPELLYDDCIPFTYGRIEQLAAEMQRLGIHPELELYQPGQYWVSRELIIQGLLEPPYVFQFIMGYQTSSFPTARHLVGLIEDLPSCSRFSVVGVGKFQWAMVTMSILLGGNARVGLEDNVYLKRGRKLTGNGEAVEKVVRLAAELNREVATPAQAREMYGVGAESRIDTEPSHTSGGATTK